MDILYCLSNDCVSVIVITPLTPALKMVLDDVGATAYLLLYLSYTLVTDVPRPLTNDLWVFLFQTIDAEC